MLSIAYSIRSSVSSLTLCVLLLIPSLVWSQRMIDPLLGVSFDPEHVFFTVWRESLTTRTQLGSEHKWIFACTTLDNGSICIIAGHRWVQPDGDGIALLEPDFGAVVYREGGEDKVLGVPDRLFDSNPIVSSNIRDRLMQDAVIRYVEAFGSVEKLQAELIKQGVRSDMLPTSLINALKNQSIDITTFDSAH